MTIYLEGHDFRYALEQSVLTYFPGQSISFCGTPENADVISILRVGAVWASSSAVITVNGRTVKAAARTKCDLPDGHERVRRLNHCVKLSFYRAAKLLTGTRPPWGSLTGIRPVKLMAQMSSGGMTLEEAAKRLTLRYDVTPERARLALDAARASQKCRHTLKPEDISLYVGIPFCPSRCAYCSFISRDLKNSARLMTPYVQALLREIELAAQAVKQLCLRVTCVYIGGGTPTCLPDDLLEAVLHGIECNFGLDALREYTVEAGRPDTFTVGKLGILRTYGADRISINPQSMNDGTLRAIGRRHSANDVRAAYEMASAAGFRTINMDVIAGLPTLIGQNDAAGYETPADFRHTLSAVLDMKPQNITVHTLARKRGSGLSPAAGARSDSISSDIQPEDYALDVAGMIGAAMETLPLHGYKPYYLYRQKQMAGAFENTGWCKDGYEGYYNLVIMEELQTVLALGAGGVTKLVHPPSGLIQRCFNSKYPTEYINAQDKIERNIQKVMDFYRR